MNQFSEKQNELSTALVDAYEASRSHRIAKDAFKTQSEQISLELTACEMKERALISEKAKCKEQLRQLTHLITMLRAYQDSRVLTRELVEAYIDRILVFSQRRVEVLLAIPGLTEVLP